MPSTSHTRSSFAHILFRARPGLAASVEQAGILDHLRDRAADSGAVRLDEVMYYGSGAHWDDNGPWREDVELLDELLMWWLGAIVLCERGTLRARYQVSGAGTRDESAAIILSAADDKEAE